MNFVRSGLLLVLLGTGITLILLSRCVQNPLPKEDLASGPVAAGPASRPAPSLPGEERKSGTGEGISRRDQGATLPSAARNPLSGAEEVFVQGLVVDPAGRPVEGARVEALEKRPADAVGSPPLTLLQKSMVETMKQYGGIEKLDPLAFAEKASRRVFSAALPAAPLEPHAITGKDGRFRLGPLHRPSCWLRAAKGPMATITPVRARQGRPVLLVLLPSASLQVTVLGPGGKPIPHCPVRLVDQGRFHQFNQGGMGASVQTYLEGRTGANGTFTFLHLPPGGPYSALALPEGWAPALSKPLLLSPGPIRKVVLQAGRGGTAQVRVEGDPETPLAGAFVRLFPLSVPLALAKALAPAPGTTGSDGKVTFHGLLPGEWGVQAFTPDRQPAAETFSVRPGGTARPVLVLPAGSSLKGVVKNEAGIPIQGALVGFSIALQGMNLETLVDPLVLIDPRSAARTGPTGEFTLSGLPGRLLTLTAWAPGYAPVTKKGIRPGPRKKVTLVLTRDGSVSGLVQDPTGKPVPSFTVEAWKEGMMGMRRMVTSRRFRSKEGRFHLAGIPPGPISLIVRSPELAPKEVPDLTVESGSELKLREPIRLPLPSRVEGKVVDRQGLPVPAALVRLIPAGKVSIRIPGFAPPAPSAWTGPGGFFRIERTPPGTWRIEAEARGRGFAEGEQPITTKEGIPVEDVLLVLQPPASLEGRVYDGKGLPDAGVPILLQRIENGAFLQKWSRTGADGRFIATGLRPGTWQVMTMGRKLAKAAFGIQDQVRKKGTIDLKDLMSNTRMERVQLEPGKKAQVTLGSPALAEGVLEGKVTAGGKPLGGALVTVIPTGEGKKLSPRFTVAGKNGGFRLEHLPDGTYVAVVTPGPGRGTQKKKSFRIQAGGSVTIHVDFGGSSVEGILLPQGKGPLPAGRLVILRKEGKEDTAGTTLTDEKGRFRFQNLSPGTYRAFLTPLIKPAKGEPCGKSEAFQVRDVGDRPVKIQIPVFPAGEIRGSLEPFPGKEVRVTAQVEGWPIPFKGKVGPDGLFRIPGVPPGKARITALAGKLKGALEVLTNPGETTHVVIHLR